jgi:hypothetical protein
MASSQLEMRALSRAALCCLRHLRRTRAAARARRFAAAISPEKHGPLVTGQIAADAQCVFDGPFNADLTVECIDRSRRAS